MFIDGDRFHFNGIGYLVLNEPGLDDLEFFRMIDPTFQFSQAPLHGFTIPKFEIVRKWPVGMNKKEMKISSWLKLFRRHERLMKLYRAGKPIPRSNEGEASLLDLKIELTFRILKSCSLCQQLCRIDRTRGKKGFCKLGLQADFVETYINYAEEPPINPSLMIYLAGCGLRCSFCQKGILQDPTKITGKPLSSDLWERMDNYGARSLSFSGGNPDESLYSILKFLKYSPKYFHLPIVWNCNGYGSALTLKLLEGVVDAYVPDFKYGNKNCGASLSQVPDYPITARKAVSNMLAQQVPVFVRILVLPGHFACCHRPVLEFLASIKKDNLWISVRSQYKPDWNIDLREIKLLSPVSTEEVVEVRELAVELGISLID